MYHKPTERVLSVFTHLANWREGRTLTDLANSLNIPKSTISPILQEMVYQNYLYLDNQTNKYHIGITTHAIASYYDPLQEIFTHIQREMKNITAKTNEICQLGILEGPNVLYIAKEEPTSNLEIQIISYVGKLIPAYCTALGKSLLAGYDISQLKDLYPNGLLAQTENTITDINKLKKQLDNFSVENIFYEEEEVTPYLCCYATPINLHNNQRIALSISLPVFRVNETKKTLIKKLLLQAREKFNVINKELSV
ncbi:IclR family transcriptional regulator [Lonepinella koalarum]|uniref:HTH-type transcriptional repressor AllR n=1 Tax=Lonepinella koalarum TaxID=53417 RepID=A0A4R1KSD4_9PAST|nr:IclR family transcriptional regulator [Lonepinella koalarum]MDH2925656.1 hypothetical protein [Lonepinella koalarum]TCK67149.1 IclR family transcriptional regulator [Lonepinella koalarum]TFJ89193.1 IclR family transcriptional regulator [Lonepinella koalarum]TYG34978.1 IclR family transcriptional regulator [Lonepinella koalarum]